MRLVIDVAQDERQTALEVNANLSATREIDGQHALKLPPYETVPRTEVLVGITLKAVIE